MNNFSLFIKVALVILVMSFNHKQYADFSGCLVNSSTVHFGEYSALVSRATASRARIRLQCYGTGSYTLSLNPGVSSQPGVRELKSSQDKLFYNLFIDPAMSMIWGDGNANTHTLAGSFNNNRRERHSRQSHIVYGSIYPSQDAYPGDYTDRLLVTLTF